MISRLSVPVSIGVMTRTTRGHSRLIRALAFSGALVAASFAVAGPAQASDGDPIRIKFDPVSVEVEYGTSWDLGVATYDTRCGEYHRCHDNLEFTVTGPDAFRKKFKRDILQGGRVYISQYEVSDSMPAGTYSVAAKFNGPLWDPAMPVVNSPANTPAKLVITPAKLSVDFRIETDEHQPSGAIASAQLVGPFVQGAEDCYGYEKCHLPVPDGEWAFTIKDESGAVVAEKKIPVKGDATQFASFYWHDVPAESNFTGSATFTPVSGQAGNFTITPENELLFTSPDAPEVDESDPAVVVPVTEEPEAPSTVPLWLVILGLGILVLLLIAVAVFFILLRRQSAPAVSDDEIEPVTEGGNV